jgi:hypothetical protein
MRIPHVPAPGRTRIPCAHTRAGSATVASAPRVQDGSGAADTRRGDRLAAAFAAPAGAARLPRLSAGNAARCIPVAHAGERWVAAASIAAGRALTPARDADPPPPAQVAAAPKDATPALAAGSILAAAAAALLTHTVPDAPQAQGAGVVRAARGPLHAAADAAQPTIVGAASGARDAPEPLAARLERRSTGARRDRHAAAVAPAGAPVAAARAAATVLPHPAATYTGGAE